MTIATTTITTTTPPRPPSASTSGRALAVASALAQVVQELPGGGEARVGQVRMASITDVRRLAAAGGPIPVTP